MIVKQFVIIIIFIITLYLSRDLITALLSQVIIQFGFLILIEKRYIRFKYPVFYRVKKFSSIKEILFLGIPLGFVQMLFSLNTNFSRYILEYFESPEVLGYFSAIIYLVIVVNLFMNSISQVYLPKISKYFINKEIIKFKKIIFFILPSISLALGFFMIIITYIFGEELLAIIYGVDYANYSDIFFLLSIAVSINLVSWNFDTALMAMRYVKIQPIIAVIVVVFNVIITYLLVLNFGITGAVVSMILVNLFQLILRILAVSYKLKKQIV